MILILYEHRASFFLTLDTLHSIIPYIVNIGTHQRITPNFAQKSSNLSLLVLRTAIPHQLHPHHGPIYCDSGKPPVVGQLVRDKFFVRREKQNISQVACYKYVDLWNWQVSKLVSKLEAGSPSLEFPGRASMCRLRLRCSCRLRIS